MIRLVAIALIAAGCGDDAGRDPAAGTEGTSSSSGDADSTGDGVDTTDGEDTVSVGDDDDDDDDATDGMTTTGTAEGGGCVDDDDCADGAAPFCNGAGACVACDGMPDGDAACEQADAGAPVCSDGVCVQCTADAAEACGGDTPVCGVDEVCRGCVEHFECPESACHLDGGDAGACFDEGDVVMIAYAGQLNTVLGGLGGSDQAVLVLAAGTYATTLDVGDSVELAILGGGSVTIAGDGGLNSVEAIGSSITYLQGIDIANISGNGIACSGTSVWLDDSEVRNNAQVGLDISGGCAAHLRRTVVAVNNAGGIDIAGGELWMHNSVVARNGDEFSSTVGGISLDGTTVDIRYSTIAINEALNAARGSMFCAGGESGSIRNSIIVAGGNTVDGCAAALFDNNAVDDGGLGGSNDNVGGAVPGWFASVGTNDFHLTDSGVDPGVDVFMDIAQWEDGDPLADVDGDPIPTEMPSFPGYDQP